VASERLALTASGQVRYTLKTAYRDGTTQIVCETKPSTPPNVAMSWARRLKRIRSNRKDEFGVSKRTQR